MPELPEVEVILRGISPHFVKRTITGFGWSGKQLRLPLPAKAQQNKLLGAKVVRSYRRAKYLVFILDNGHSLIIHLGMTGNLGIFQPIDRLAKHDHFWCTLDNNTQFRYNDTRRFGSIQIMKTDDENILEKEIFTNLGPEPLKDAFSATYLFQKAKNRTISVKTFLMTGEVVVGIGNIYANEGLFRAGISPKRSAKSLRKKDWQNVVEKIREVLLHAIECGGSTISDFVDAGGESGYFQMNFKVYGKKGEPCPQCQSLIHSEKIGGRASFFCTSCQK